MQRRGNSDSPGGRLARSYLAVRAEQSAEPGPRPRPDGLRAAIRLPRLDRVQLTSPEAHAQYRLALLARLASAGGLWFVLAAARRR